MLSKEIQQGIIQKANDINTNNPCKLRDEVKDIIDKLYRYINNETSYSTDEIQQLCKRLLCFTTIAPIPLKNITISRARRDKSFQKLTVMQNYHAQSNSFFPSHNNAQDLSYINISSGKSVPLGRMNSFGQSIFYASLDWNRNSIGTVLSEANATDGAIFNILYSYVQNEINVSPIGVFDYFRRGVPCPFTLHNDFQEMYDLYRKYTNEHGMIALQLCDAFLIDILKKQYSDKEKTEKLYTVTSEIANDILSVESVDGLLYPSVKFEGFPNIAIKPTSVDNHIKYKTVQSVEILKDFGYGIYQTRLLYHGQVNEKNLNIEWKKY